MYPIQFSKVLKEKVWGGSYFAGVLSYQARPGKLYGEYWGVSSRKNGMSLVANGKFKDISFQELINKHGETLLGKEVYGRFGTNFPLLVKYLDINDKLSVQVHPDDKYAREKENEPGKYESWYVIRASEDAKIIMGMARGIDKEQFCSRMKKRDFSGLFNIISVKKGDFIDIKPGTVHATLEGSVVICEVQQNSDATYRIYDFDRLFNGCRRELHFDKSLDVIDFNSSVTISSCKSREKQFFESAAIERLTSNDYYSIDMLTINGAFNVPVYPGFKIYSALEGKGSIVHENIEYELNRGDTYFIPAGLTICIKGRVKLLCSFM